MTERVKALEVRVNLLEGLCLQLIDTLHHYANFTPGSDGEANSLKQTRKEYEVLSNRILQKQRGLAGPIS